MIAKKNFQLQGGGLRPFNPLTSGSAFGVPSLGAPPLDLRYRARHAPPPFPASVSASVTTGAFKPHKRWSNKKREVLSEP